MESEKTKWIQTQATRALDFWRHHEHTLKVSEDYRRQLEIDLDKQYDDPLKRKFMETLWVDYVTKHT